MQITTLQAQALIAAAEQKAREFGLAINIAILDGGAHLKAFARMDDALLGSIDVAIRKAKTAVLFAMNSEDVGEFCKPGGSSPGLAATNEVLVVFAGGIPVRDDRGVVIGAIGVSGGTVEQDYAVAFAAVNSSDPTTEQGRCHD